MINNQRGIALIQTLVLATAVTFLAYYLMDLGNLLNQKVKLNLLAESLRDYKSQVSLILSDTNSCLSTVANLDQNGMVLNNKTEINAIKIRSLDHSQTPPAIVLSDLFAKDSEYRGLKVLEYKLIRVSGQEGKQGALRLYILEAVLGKVGDNQTVVGEITEKFDVYAAEASEGGFIISCYVNSSEDKLAKYFCENTLGGQIYEHIGVKGSGHCIIDGKYIEDKLQAFYDKINENKKIQTGNKESMDKNSVRILDLRDKVQGNATRLNNNKGQLNLEKDFHL